jgi:hypothetical protein
MLLKYLLPQYNGADWKGHVTYNMGGGDSPAPAPQPTQTSQVTIPEYAKPTVERMIGKAEALTSAPYQTYGGQRIAEATPEQRAARAGVAGLQTPGQFAAGTGLVGAGGLASLGAGQTYMGMATSPEAQQAFMSPYMQNVVDVQQREAIRAAQQGQLGANLAAARQGTYGGARQTLAMTERERNLQDQMARIQATGLQSAYDQAQRAMQFGTQAGLTGAGQAAQAGLGLGQLGTAGQAADIQRLQAQEQFGGLEQQAQQRALEMAYQDFVNQQQYPYKNLGFLSDILRGSANLAATGGKTVYEAPPSMLSQIGGVGLGALGLSRLMG